MKLLAQHRRKRRREKSSKYQANNDGQVLVSINSEKTAALASVRKNSAKLTEPMVVRGSLPELTSVDVTTGPQPPPPAASTKPPNKASFPTCLGACCAGEGGETPY